MPVSMGLVQIRSEYMNIEETSQGGTLSLQKSKEPVVTRSSQAFKQMVYSLAERATPSRVASKNYLTPFSDI